MWENNYILIMSKPTTGKTTTSVWKQKRKICDIYVWERQTVYIPETRKTKELSRKLLGKIPAGSADDEIVPLLSKKRPKRKKTEDAVPQSSTRSRVGSSSLLRWVGEQSGISEDLLSCMDEGSAKKVDTIAQFWLANQGDRLQRMQKWQFLHPTPYSEPISKEVYRDLFEYLGLNEGIVQNYFLPEFPLLDNKYRSGNFYTQSLHKQTVLFRDLLPIELGSIIRLMSIQH